MDQPSLPRWFVVGFFGTGNFGDELFTELICSRIDELGLPKPIVHTRSKEVTRTSVRPEVTPTFGFFLSKKGVKNVGGNYRLVGESDAMIVGGGGLFNETFSRWGMLNYLTVFMTALSRSKPLVFHGIEVGTVKSPFLRRMITWVSNASSDFAVRDPLSAETLKSWGVTRPISIEPDLSHWYLREWFDRHPGQTVPKRAFVNLQTSARRFPEKVRPVIEELLSQGYTIDAVPCSPSETEFYASFGNEAIRIHQPAASDRSIIEEVLTLISQAEIVLAERLHYVIAGYHSPARLVPVVSTRKVADVLDLLGFMGERVWIRTERQSLPDSSRTSMAGVKEGETESATSKRLLDARLLNPPPKPPKGVQMGAALRLPLLLGYIAFYGIQSRFQKSKGLVAVDEL